MDNENKKRPNDNDERKFEHIDTEEELFDKLEEIISSDEKSTQYVINKNILPVRMIRVFNNFWVDFFYGTIISMVLLISLCGWFEVIKAKHFYELIILGFSFGVIDYLAKTLLFKINPVIYLKTAGLIFALISTIVMALVCTLGYFIFKVDFASAWTIVLCHLSLLITRFLISSYIKKIK